MISKTDEITQYLGQLNRYFLRRTGFTWEVDEQTMKTNWNI